MATDSVRGGRRALMGFLFVVYLGLLIWVVLWKVHVPFIGRDDMREIKLIPFVSNGRFGASDPLELLGNVLLFVPMGIYLCTLAPTWRVRRVVLVSAGASLVLEVVQYITAVGSSDITDVITNVAGALAGIGLFWLAHRILQNRTAALLMWVCAAGTAVSLIATIVIVLSLPRLPPPNSNGTVTTISVVG